MDFINYIRPELLVVAVALYLLGILLKKIKTLKDNFIPLILGGVGILICFAYIGSIEGFVWQSLVSGVLQGLLCAAASTYVNQVIKQMHKLGIDEKVTRTAEKLVEQAQKEKEEK